MINKTTHLTDDQINDLVAIIERNARTTEEADAATDATARYIAINRIFDTICPIANIVLAIAAATIAAMLTHNILIIAAAVIIADALPAIAYGTAAAPQAKASENALDARLDTIIATL